MSDHLVMTLLGIGSVATAISGFSGVVAAFSGRVGGKWSPAERFRTTNMLILSLGACLLSFLPLTEELFQVPEQILWAIASFSLFIFGTFYFIHTMMRIRMPDLRRPGMLIAWVRV